MSDGNKSRGEVMYFRNEMIARCRAYIAGMAEIGADPRDLEAALAPLLGTSPPSAPVGVEDSLVQTALRNLPQYISKSGLVGPDKHSAMQCFEVLQAAIAQQQATPKGEGCASCGDLADFLDEGGLCASCWCAQEPLDALDQQPATCGTCREVIRPDALTGTTCKCAQQPAAKFTTPDCPRCGCVDDGMCLCQPAAVDGDFIKRIADSLIAKGWDLDPDCDGTGVIQLREAVISALAAQPGGGR